MIVRSYHFGDTLYMIEKFGKTFKLSKCLLNTSGIFVSYLKTESLNNAINRIILDEPMLQNNLTKLLFIGDL